MHWLTRCSEVQVDTSTIDHCYTRPWNWKPENIYIKPVKKIFFPKPQNTGAGRQKQEEEIDVVGFDEPSNQLCNSMELKRVMDESQTLAKFSKNERDDNWQTKIDENSFTSEQSEIFTNIIAVLNEEHVARLARANTPLELVHRRTSLNIATKKFRQVLASCDWDCRMTQWLHGLLFDNLPQDYLAIYMDILQTLRHKVPQLIDKMVWMQMQSQTSSNTKASPLTWEVFGTFLKKSWDPVASVLNKTIVEKLPGNPILVVVPTGINTTNSMRQHKWILLLESLGVVVNLTTNLPENEMSQVEYMEHLFQITRSKVQNLKCEDAARPIILVGYHSGAGLACQVAQFECVTAVVCLGFPFNTCEGKRGTPEDFILDLKCPVLFVIGQNATLANAEDLEDLRRKMLVETSLVVVGSADDRLRISSTKKMLEGITQTVVDRCVLEEVGNFLGNILLQPHPLPLRQLSPNNVKNRSKKVVGKRTNSSASTVSSDIHPPSAKKSKSNTTNIAPKASSSSTVSKPCLASPSTIPTVMGTPLSSMPRHKAGPSRIKNTPISGHLITSHLTPQQSVKTSGSGITLNIGSLASLAPTGPIRLTPVSINQPATLTTGNINVSQMKTSSFTKTTKLSPMLPRVTLTPCAQNLSKVNSTKPMKEEKLEPLINTFEPLQMNEGNDEMHLLDALMPLDNDIQDDTLATTNELPFQFW